MAAKIRVRCTGLNENPGAPGTPPTYNFTWTIVPNQDPSQPNMSGVFQVYNAANVPIGFGQEMDLPVAPDQSAPAPAPAGTSSQTGPAPSSTPPTWGAGR